MKLPAKYIDYVALKFTAGLWNERAVRYFLKTLVVYFLLKVVLIWPVANQILQGQRLVVPRSVVGKILLWPSQLARVDVDIFYAAAVCVLTIILFLRLNYFFLAIFFWIVLNVFRVNFPITNGSDYVILMLSIFCIPLAARPALKSDRWRKIQIALHNTFVIMVQLQVVFIYFMSGWDKLVSPVWRSGEAFSYIQHIDTMLNPVFYYLLESERFNFMYAWLTIGFELAFVVLVWFKRTRIFILVVGVFFHFVIWIMLSLPDFALMMVLSYLIFLKDEEYERLFKWIKMSGSESFSPNALKN